MDQRMLDTLYPASPDSEDLHQMGLLENAAGQRVWYRRKYLALRRDLAEAPEAGSLAGWDFLPEDLGTHLEDFAKACEIAQQASTTEVDRSYWQHQVRVLERARALIEAGPGNQGPDEADGPWAEGWEQRAGTEGEQ